MADDKKYTIKKIEDFKGKAPKPGKANATVLVAKASEERKAEINASYGPANAYSYEMIEAMNYGVENGLAKQFKKRMWGKDMLPPVNEPSASGSAPKVYDDDKVSLNVPVFATMLMFTGRRREECREMA